MNLEGREARCPYCMRTTPSSEALPFFEYRGPGSKDAEERCSNCGYSKCAHEPAHMETLVYGRDGRRRPTVVEDGRCSGFENRPEGREFDLYYDGCRGWN